MKSCSQEISNSPRLAHTITLKTYLRTNMDPNTEASASISQLDSTGKLVTLKMQDLA